MHITNNEAIQRPHEPLYFASRAGHEYARFRNPRCTILCTLCAFVLASCGSQSGIEPSATDVIVTAAPGSTSNRQEPTSTNSTIPEAANTCEIPDGFGSTPAPAKYPLRADEPESQVPIDTSIKRPIVSSPQAAVDRVVSQFHFADIKYARLGGPPDPGAVGPYLYMLASVPSTDGQFLVRPQWEAITIMGDAAELAATGADLGDTIEGFVIALQTPDCQIVSQQAAHIGPRAAGQVFAGTNSQTAIDYASAVLDKYGANPVSVETLDGVSAVLSVTASISDPKAMNGTFPAMFSDLTGTPPRFASVYLQLQTTAGDALAISAGSARLASGVGWTQPGLEDVLGIQNV